MSTQSLKHYTHTQSAQTHSTGSPQKIIRKMDIDGRCTEIEFVITHLANINNERETLIINI